MEKNFFGVMLDCSRNAVMKPTEVVNFAKILKSFGYNMLQLYTEDTYEVENEPFFGYMRGRYTQEDICYIVNECDKIGMEVIPCIQTLAHLNQIFRWPPYRQSRDTADILLAGEERTYEIVENMFKTLRKCFKTKYLHIGMDEAEMIGRGKFYEKNGPKNRLDVLREHLKKVCVLAKKYDFKPIMWSDMFFKLATDGVTYYHENPNVTEDVKNAVPSEIGLVYWDYYHEDKAMYDGMMSAHQKFNNEIWFAGGAWTWSGFAPGNEFTLKTMLPAMQSAKEHGIKNVFLTMWGDNGKECSFYAILPALYAVKRAYDGETDETKIKAEFKAITGEDYDALSACDIPNYVSGNRICYKNVCKYALYADPFNSFMECKCKDGVNDEYVKHTETLWAYAKASKQYAYLFESLAALCDVLSVKYALGKRTRQAYKAKDAKALEKVIKEYITVEEKVEVFYKKFRALWYKENKPTGFDIQDIRIGALKQRLRSCRERLEEYWKGEIENIPELEEEILDCFPELEIPEMNSWDWIVSANVM